MPFVSSVAGTFSPSGKLQLKRGTRENPAKNAQELLDFGLRTDGLYWIKPSETATAQQIYCILDTTWDGGGWMVLSHNAALDIIYLSGHRPRLTANPSYVGNSGPGAPNFNFNWSVNAQDIQFTKLAWCAYGLNEVTLSNWSITSNIVTVNTGAAHGFTVGNQVTIWGSRNTTTGSTIDGNRFITAVPSSTSFTFDLTTSDTSATPTPRSFSITGYAVTTNVMTVTTSVTHDFIVGEVVRITSPVSILNGDFYILTIPTTNSFTIQTTNADVVTTSTTGTAVCRPVVTSVNYNRNIKSIFSYFYGTFNSPTTIPNSTAWTRLFDGFTSPFPWDINDTKVLKRGWSSAASYFEAISLYDGIRGDANYTIGSYYPVMVLGTKNAGGQTSTNNNSNAIGISSVFSFSDRHLLSDVATIQRPEGTGTQSQRGWEDYQDGNSLGDGWGNTSGLLQFGRGAPSYIMVK